MTVAGELVALLVIVRVPVVLPAVVGVNVTATTTDCPAASICPELIPLKLKPEPVMATCEIVTLELPLLVTLTFCVLLLPTCTLPKFKLDGLLSNCSVEDTPVPLREIVKGEFGALLASDKLPLSDPAEVGAKTTVKVELAPGLIVSGMLSPLVLKLLGDGLSVAWVIVRSAVPGLLSMTVCNAWLPIFTLPKLRLEGTAESCG